MASHLTQVDPRDRALLQQICFGTLRQYFRLQGILSQALKKPLKARDGDLQALMLCGLHQLLDMRTPDHAAIDRTVEAARSLGKPWATGLVNGVLRRCKREADVLEAGLSAEARANQPAWLHRAMTEAWPEQLASIIEASNSHPPMYLRVNQRHISRDGYLEQLEGAGIGATSCQLAEQGIRLDKPVDVLALPGFEAGLVSVQDEAAQLAAPLLRVKAGDRVLDACSAPGGKTCHILETQPDIAELVAMDSDEQRLARVRENLDRLGLRARLLPGDGRTPPADLEMQSFDRILADVPCSGTGVIRRHPDIRLLRRPGDITGFRALQLDILRGLWPLLKPGGELLYVTCSILPAENAAVVATFAEETADAEILPLEVDWGVPAGDGRQLLPEAAGTDGLFFARLGRRSSSGVN